MDSNANGDRKSLAFGVGISNSILFTAQKTRGDSRNFSVFPSGDVVQRSFPMRMEFQGIFLTGDDFGANFSSCEGVPPGL